MAKVTRTCDNCKQLLRLADKYEPLNDSRFRNLCKKCFDLWLDDKLDKTDTFK